jgi:CheY-like chemotaxis protein
MQCHRLFEVRPVEMEERAHLLRGSDWVLLVDDDASLVEALRQLLEQHGFLLVTAGDGHEALEVLDRLAPACPAIVVTDLVMPRLSGWELVKRLRATDRLAEIPICVLTASDPEPPGATCILRKPVRIRALVELLRKYCEVTEQV